MHDNVEVPFTDKPELLLFRILFVVFFFFSHILNVLILLGFGVSFGLDFLSECTVLWVRQEC